MTVTKKFLKIGDIIEADDSWIIDGVQGFTNRRVSVSQRLKARDGEMLVDYKGDIVSSLCKERFAQITSIHGLLGVNGQNLTGKRFAVTRLTLDLYGDLKGQSIATQLVYAKQITNENKQSTTDLTVNFLQASSFEYIDKNPEEYSTMRQINRTGHLGLDSDFYAPKGSLPFSPVVKASMERVRKLQKN